MSDKEALIDAVNKLYIDPASRASNCLRVLKEAGITDWDQTCFAAETLGHLALMLDDKALVKHVKEVLKVVYRMHYYHAPVVIGEPDLLTWNGRVSHGVPQDSTQRSEDADVSGQDEEREEDTEVPGSQA